MSENNETVSDVLTEFNKKTPTPKTKQSSGKKTSKAIKRKQILANLNRLRQANHKKTPKKKKCSSCYR